MTWFWGIFALCSFLLAAVYVWMWRDSKDIDKLVIAVLILGMAFADLGRMAAR